MNLLFNSLKEQMMDDNMLKKILVVIPFFKLGISVGLNQSKDGQAAVSVVQRQHNKMCHFLNRMCCVHLVLLHSSKLSTAVILDVV